MAKAGLQFNKKDEWYTPKEVVDFFGPFDYDPATTAEQAAHLGIETFDDINSDGLKTNWGYHKRIWVNPPFTRKFEFLDKAVETVMWHESKIFFLLPAETLTTKIFHEIVGGQPYTLWVPNGRIKFEDGSNKPSTPAFGSVILEFDNHFAGTQIKHWRLNENKSEKPTIWGYEQDDIKLARKLMECGITPQELKEHLHDFEWVVKKVREDVDRIIQAPIKEAVESHKSWSFFNDNKPYELDCSKMGWTKRDEEDLHGSAD